MVDLAFIPNDSPLERRQRAIDRGRRADARFMRLTQAMAIVVLAIFIGIIWTLLAGAWPALSTYGFSFLWTAAWNPVTERFGAPAGRGRAAPGRR